MKKLFLAGLIFLIGYGYEDGLATSVVELANNPSVVGWKDSKEVNNTKVIVKKVYIKTPLKDSDKDGVVDRLDKCPNTPKGVLVNHYGCPIISTLRLNFDFNKAKVKKIYYKELKKVAEILKANPKLKIEIDGYTDNIGSQKYNLQLSLKRAKAVRDILVNVYKINPKRIKVRGFGKAYPLVPNTTSTNRALNRRVEIVGLTN